MALALRTMVIPTAAFDTMYSYSGPRPRREWVVHLQVQRQAVCEVTCGGQRQEWSP